MGRVLRSIWPHLFIIFLVLVFFYPFFLQDKIPLPADIIVGVSSPWRQYQWSEYPLGVPVKNPIISDAISLTYPFRDFSIEQFKKGIFPLWNPLIFTGTPLFANFQSAVLSPINIFYLFFDKVTAWGLGIIFQPLLAALFLYSLSRSFKLSKLASIISGLIYAFSGFIIIFLEWNTLSLVAAFFPAIFLLVFNFLETKKSYWGVLLSVALALQIFSGYPQIILYELIAIAVFVLFFFKQKIQKINYLLYLGLFILLGIGLAGIQLIPGIELLSLSQREVEIIPDEWTYLPWQLIITFFAPDFFGNHTTYNYWSPFNYTLHVGYTGIVASFLAGLGILTKAKEFGVRFGVMLVLLALILSTQNPLTIFLKESGLLGLQAGTYHRSLLLLNLGVAILAGFGFEQVLNRKYRLEDILRASYIPYIFLGGFGISSLIILFILRENPELNYYKNLWIGIKNLALPFVFLTSSFFLLIVSILFKRIHKGILLILALLIIGEHFRFGWKFTTFSDREFVFPNAKTLEFIKNEPKPFRTFASNVIPTNFMMAYGLETIEGYDSLYPLQFAKYLAVLNSGDPGSQPQDRYGAVSKIDSRLLNLANVKYIFGQDEKGKLPEKYNSPNLKPIFKENDIFVFENLNVFPRAKMYYQWEVDDNQTSVLGKLEKDFPIDSMLILDDDPNIEAKIGEGFLEALGMYSYKLNTSQPGMIFIANSYYPGWKAFIDNQEVKIIKANYNFMAIPINQAGEFKVDLKYEPDSFKLGILISLISAGLLFLLWMNKARAYAKKKLQSLFLTLSSKI